MNKRDKHQARASSPLAPRGRFLPGLVFLVFCLYGSPGAAREVPVENQHQGLETVPTVTFQQAPAEVQSQGTVSLPTATVQEAPAENQFQSPSLFPFVVITGTLIEKGTKKPLARVNVYCFPESSPEKPIKTGTDKSGKFSIKVPAGKFKWVLSASGYKRLEREDEQSADTTVASRVFYLEKISYLSYETTVYAQTEKRDDTTKSLDQAQFATVPGANGDPVKAVQNLPGVNRPGAFSSQVIIEGSSPNDTRYNIDNQNVPLIFHFGGLSSVVIPEAIDHVDYLSAGFGPEYGQSIAGLVNLTVRDPQTDRLHGFAFVDLQNAGGMVEGPINDHSSFLAGARQSYIGYVLGAVVRSRNDNKSFELTAVPEFRDMVLEYKNQPTTDDTVKIVGVGSQDTFAFLLKQPTGQDPSVRGNFNLDTKFFRIIPEWTHHYSSTMIGRYSLGAGKDWVLFDIGDFYSHTDQTALTGRAEIEAQFNSAWKSYSGIDVQHYLSTVSYHLPIFHSQGGIANPISSDDLQTVSKHYTADATGLYWRNVIHTEDSRWTFIPGARVSLGYFNGTREVLPEPRVAARYALDRGWMLRAGTGLYSEAPPLQDLDPTFGNPNLKSQRAIHGVLGIEKDFREGSATGWTVSNDVFYKKLYNLVASSTAFVSPSQPEYFNNSGYGHIYGWEFLGKYKTTNWQGWISYTLSRSTRGNAEIPEAISQFDQTHILTIVGDRELGRNWKISTRVRYTSGNPFTPVVGGIFDVNNDVYTPVRGPVYSQRMGAFFQADVRFDKKWIYDRWIITGYLDIENVTNRSNPEQINYSYNFQQAAVVTGLPVFPTFGVRAEF